MENFAYILDYLPHGRATERGFHRDPLALAVGEDGLKLFELVPKAGTAFKTGDRIPLLPHEGILPPIDHVRRRLGLNDLTVDARTELPAALERIVSAHPERYLRLFNEAQAVSRRFHLLELLPGVGKKTMQLIVEERRRGPFASFDDLERRVPLKDPEQLVVARITQELGGVEDKYRLFVAP